MTRAGMPRKAPIGGTTETTPRQYAVHAREFSRGSPCLSFVGRSADFDAPAGARGCGATDGCGAADGGGAKAAANSGRDPRKTQSAPPSGKTGVFFSTRFSAIHCFTCSAETGPYSFPSVPRTLYMAAFYLSSLSQAAWPRSAHTPRLASTTKSSRFLAGALVNFSRASVTASRRFFPLRNNRW